MPIIFSLIVYYRSLFQIEEKESTPIISCILGYAPAWIKRKANDFLPN